MKQIAMKTILMVLLTMHSLANNFSFSEDYNKLLKKHLKNGTKHNITAALVDYQRWKQDPLHHKSMSALQKATPSSLKNTAEKLTFWINTYNLLTIDLIIKENEEESIKNLGSIFISPWKKHHWTIGGQNYTLHQIEHDILRPLNDWRIHMAINCASLSCPDLRKEAYDIDQLDKQLDEQVALFLNNTSKGVNGNKISKIFDWFEDDFDGEAGVSKITGVSKPNYIKYNWQLNSQ